MTTSAQTRETGAQTASIHVGIHARAARRAGRRRKESRTDDIDERWRPCRLIARDAWRSPHCSS